MADRQKLVTELERLDGALIAVSFQIRLAAARRQFLGSNGQEEEARLSTEMDRVMTRLRSVEAKLATIDSGEKIRFE